MASAGEEVNTEELRANARKAAQKASKKPASSNTTTYIALGSLGVIVALVVGLLVLHPEVPPHLIPALEQQYMDSQNTLNLGYTQKSNEYFKDWSLADVKLSAQTGLSQQARNMNPCTSYMNEGELVPNSFDLRDEYPHCIQEVRSQGNCSSSYAFATASAVSERFCMLSNGKITETLSPQDLISCSKRNTACTSGNIDSAWGYVRDSGLVDEHCFQYQSKDMNSVDCNLKCDGPSYMVKDVCATAGEGGIMREIKNNGPVVALIQLYSDFLGYSTGVYEPHISSTKVQGVQAVEVLGWGVNDKAVPYWIIKNSWGSEWGENGYGYVIRGNKDLGLEDFAVTGTPSITQEMLRSKETIKVEEFEEFDEKNVEETVDLDNTAGEQ